MKLKRYKFHQHKSPFLVDNIDINKIAVYNKVSFGKKGFKYFIGYKDAKKQTFIHIPFKNECIQKRF